MWRQKRKGKPYGNWFATIHGERVNLGTRDKAIAKQVRQRLEREALLPATKPKGTVTLLDAAAQFMDGASSQLSDGSVDYYEKRLRQLVAGLGPDVRLDELTRALVESYYRRRRLEVSDATMGKESQALRRLLKVMQAHDLFHGELDAIAPKFRAKYVPRDRWMTTDECASLLGQLRPRRRLWVQVAIYTGARKSEVERLEWRHVSLARDTVAIPGTKTDAARRRVPLAAPLRAALIRVEGGPGRIVGRWSNVGRDLGEACDRAQIDRVTPNDLRRTFASWMLQQGVPPFTVAKLLGHASLQMVLRVYGQLGDAELIAAVKTLPGVTPKPTII